MPLGVGQGQNVVVRDFFHILTLLPPEASVFHKHMSSLCIYLGEGKGGGGCTNACICMGTHVQSLLQNHLMDGYETW